MEKLIYLLLILIIISIAFLANKKVTAPVVENESVAVEKYVRDNIKTIATDSPVLGGSWYVVSIEINTENKSGFVTYEDGHIQSKATFSYFIENKEIKISNWKKE